MNFKMLLILPLAFMMVYCGNNDPQTPDLKYPATFKFKKLEYETPKQYIVQSNGDLKEFPNSPNIQLALEDLKESNNELIANEPLFYDWDYIIKSPNIIRLNLNGDDTLSLPYERTNSKITVKEPGTNNIFFRAELIDNKTFKVCYEVSWWIKPKTAALPWGSGSSIFGFCTQEPNLLTLAQSIKTSKKLVLNDTIIVANYYGIYE
jgi:hypothetical protein